MKYDEYLRSDHWKITRTKIRRRARGWCERCKVGKRSDIHHLSYARLGEETKNDLIAVCRECHLYLHGKIDIDPAETDYTKEEIRIIRYCWWWYLQGDGLMEEILFPKLPEYEVAWNKYLLSKNRALMNIKAFVTDTLGAETRWGRGVGK